MFTRGPIKILAFKTSITSKVGTYTKESLQTFSDSWLIEAVMPIENEETLKYAKQLKDFCDQLSP